MQGGGAQVSIGNGPGIIEITNSTVSISAEGPFYLTGIQVYMTGEISMKIRGILRLTFIKNKSVVGIEVVQAVVCLE